MKHTSMRYAICGLSFRSYTLLLSIFLLNACGGDPVSLPRNWGTASVTLTHSGAYTATVRGSGTVEYTGLGGVPVRGSHESTLPKQNVITILQAIDRAQFMSMNQKDFPEASDAPYTVVSVSVDGKDKQILSFDTSSFDRARFGMGGGKQIPLSRRLVLMFSPSFREHQRFLKLVDEIESQMGTERWTQCSPKCMALLRGRWVDSRSGNGSTILLLAIKSRKDLALGSIDGSNSVNFDPNTMIEAGVDVNAADDQGLTPVMVAAENGDQELVRNLLAHGANPNARDSKGKKAADYTKDPEIRDLLACSC